MKLLTQGQGPRRWLGALLATSLALSLAACGGGAAPIEQFIPKRVMAFGDETSAITSAGQKYSINAIDSVTLLPICSANPNWVQVLAGAYGVVFAQCNPDNVAAPQGRMLAKVGAKVEDVRGQLDVFFATDSFSAKDLALLLAGANDVLELYGQYPALSRDSLIAEARTRGKLMGEQVNRVAAAGGRAIVSTIPDLGTTPFALKERLAKQDIDRVKLLSDLSSEFNTGMRLALTNDGHRIGLVLMDEFTLTATRYPEYSGFVNVTDAACLTTVAIINCTTSTLVPGASAQSWLWATDTLIGSTAQQQLGSMAAQRAANNPF
ncbi:MAG TPA: esterase [Burkholderiaceae bacterium]